MFKRWLYRGNHPNIFAKILNRGWAILHAIGIYPDRYITLEVVGRKTGKTISFPLAMVTLQSKRYLVSMLGEEVNWVKNIRSANGRAELIHGIREHVMLVEVEPQERAPIIKAYLQIAPGARPHIPISKDAPIVEFEKIVTGFPVFRLESNKS